MEDLSSENKVPISPTYTKQKVMSKLPKWLLPTLAGVILFSSVVFYLSLMRDPHAPTAIVVSACRDVAPGMRRVSSDFGTQFDLSEKAFAVNIGIQDMPPGKFYTVKLRDSGASLVIWHDDGVWGDLKNTFPVFSRHIKERNIPGAKERSVGTDRWGYLKSGERWRYVAFSSGDAIGYRPTLPKEAVLFDQVMDSACRMSVAEH
jgi:hypothetical protein